MSPLPTTPGLPGDFSCDAGPPDMHRLPEASAVNMSISAWPRGVLTASAVFELTPVEVFLEVFKLLDLATAFSLSMTNKRFASIFARYKASVVLSIVAKEFTPFRGLLQVVKAKPDDLLTPWGTWLDKRVRHNKVILCDGGLPSDTPDAACPPIQEVYLDDSDVEKILALCKVVRGWERIFPQHHFDFNPSLTRSLLPEENHRLRNSLYIWMRYSFYFHGDLPRPNTFFPDGRDVRVNQLRILPNSELRGLRDLWSTVQSTIRRKLCPSIAIVRSNAVGGHLTIIYVLGVADFHRILNFLTEKPRESALETLWTTKQ